MDLRESESTLRQYVNACIVHICELYALVRFSERPLALKCDHLPVGDEGCFGPFAAAAAAAGIPI